MNRGDVLRIAKTLAVYVILAALLWAMLPGIRRTFLLPALFDTVARGTIVVGGLFAALVAWRYPHIGEGTGGGEG